MPRKDRSKPHYYPIAGCWAGRGMGQRDRDKMAAMDALRYVVLRHEGVAEPHFDLMAESSPGAALTTWRSAVWPITEPTPLIRLADHRRAYLEYEGPLSNGRGSVRRVASGECSLDWTATPTDAVWTLWTAGPTLRLRQIERENWMASPA